MEPPARERRFRAFTVEALAHVVGSLTTVCVVYVVLVLGRVLRPPLVLVIAAGVFVFAFLVFRSGRWHVGCW